MNYLEKFKEKCKLDDAFMDKVNFLFEKLLSFGYIDHMSINKLAKKLYNNIDFVFLSPDKVHDYKTGYYDSIKKELYIKDSEDLESLFLRLVYAITTTQNRDGSYNVGYSITSLSKKNYKQEHKRFGFNRAVVSNLVCRLLYTEPTTLSIVPTYRTYTNDFLGNGIITDNNIYFLEGQILKQLCFSLGIEEEDLYYHLFINPGRYLEKMLYKGKVENPERLLGILDNASRKYSNYNKLLYLNLQLDNNYIQSKKKLPNEKTDEKIEKDRDNLNYLVSKAILEIKPTTNEDDIEDVSISLNETMNELEDSILEDVNKIQNILVDTLIISEVKYSPIDFAIRQKQLSKLLIFESTKLEENIYNTISYRILNSFESSSSKKKKKMKYSIVSEILSSDKYVKVYNSMDFNRLLTLDFSENTEIMALSVEGTFLSLIKVKDLNLPFKALINNTELVKIDNMKFLLNSPISTQSTRDIEKIYTYIRENFIQYRTIEIDKLYITNIDNYTLVLVLTQDDFQIFNMDIVDDKVICKKVGLSEKYSIFNKNNVSYKNKKFKNQE